MNKFQYYDFDQNETTKPRDSTYPENGEEAFTLRSYSAYYICSLLFNVLLTALYVVQVFSNHTPCLT